MFIRFEFWLECACMDQRMGGGFLFKWLVFFSKPSWCKKCFLATFLVTSTSTPCWLCQSTKYFQVVPNDSADGPHPGSSGSTTEARGASVANHKAKNGVVPHFKGEDMCLRLLYMHVYMWCCVNWGYRIYEHFCCEGSVTFIRVVWVFFYCLEQMYLNVCLCNNVGLPFCWFVLTKG